MQPVFNTAPLDGRSRVIIENVTPEIEGGAFAAKRVCGERVMIEADIFADGHEVISGMLLFRREAENNWHETPLKFLVNDRWAAGFRVEEIGRYRYTLAAWIDHFQSWRRDLQKKAEVNEHSELDLLTGALIIEQAARRASGGDKKKLAETIDLLRNKNTGLSSKLAAALGDGLLELVGRYPDRGAETRYDKELTLVVDREKARFSAWYEMFPRSSAAEPGVHGTFKDCERLLPYVASLGFDTLYLPPIHPIGYTHRKGKNNSTTAAAGDPGSPWAIGSAKGGHKSIHPELGTLQDFRKLVTSAESLGIEVALDLAYQCSPDHPYVREHPKWFRWRPDGSVQFAENPPKKYQDIYPLDFTSEEWRELWQELKSIVDFWREQGIRMFRVDNPHTKPLPFWQWLIEAVKQDDPEVIFLAEAFTRPKVMYRLGKLGFTQSYSYFTWRNTKTEITTYFQELTQTEVREYFRPNLWPNTPDILPEFLQFGGRAAFMIRLVLAATLSGNYGIYGPAFELLENRPRDPGSEEYLDSEKYEIKYWNRESAESLKDFIARINRIRKENPALKCDGSLCFYDIDNEQMICYTKRTEDLSNIIVVVVNLDPHHVQSGWVNIPLEPLGLEAADSYQAHDLLTGARFLWHGARNYVQLDPKNGPAHILRLRRRIRREQDFDYFM
ncbi:MAG TPA: alpha-1,4-glucan--maltose-1-phosphate maltosyltransferase [Candidatus Binatia bacterium]